MWRCTPLNRATVSTACSAEVDKFRRLSSQWWDVHGPMRTLHQFNPSRVRYIEATASKYLQHHVSQQQGEVGGIARRDLRVDPPRVLDVGCGGGILSEALARRGALVTGIDENELGIQVAKARLEHFAPPATARPLSSVPSLQYEHCSLGDMAVKEKGQFDIVIASEVLEHVSSPKSFLEQLSLCCKPTAATNKDGDEKKNINEDTAATGGLVMISTINKTILSGLVYIAGAEYLTRQVEVGTHDWAKFVPPEDVTRVMKGHRVQHLETAGILPRPSLSESSLWPTPNLGLAFDIKTGQCAAGHYFWVGRSLN